MSLLVVHYYRRKQDYQNWDIWVWSTSSQALEDPACTFSAFDEYGAVAQMQIPAQVHQVGFLLRHGGDQWLKKDLELDRFVVMTSAGAEIWVVEGDPHIYFSCAEARAVVFPRVSKAYLDASRLIQLTFLEPLDPIELQPALHVKDLTAGLAYHVQAVPVTAPAQDKTAKWQLFLKEPIDVTHICLVTGNIAADTGIVPRRVLDDAEYVYPGDDLGCRCNEDRVHFRVWAPTASSVEVLIYDTEMGPVREIFKMQRSSHGTWSKGALGSWHGKYYHYRLDSHGKTVLAVDPYTKSLSADRSRGMIVDLSQTNPDNWPDDTPIHLGSPTDAIIYEMHLRDFSAHPSAGALNPGKFIQFSDRGLFTTDGLVAGIDHLLELGITHVQILPVNEFGRFGEKNPEEYNWGYDPRFFLVPEGRYATARTGVTRIREFKRMVLAFHQQGIGVILDVVFNHVFHALLSTFHQIVPEYFFRTDDAGNLTDGARVGNELAIERPMVRKFVQDALEYWLDEYHIDGFRLDLMALFGQTSLHKIAKALRSIRPDLLIYGEPWAAGPSGIYGDALFLKGDQKAAGIAVFNDHLRDALMGPVFDRRRGGFVAGNTDCVSDVKSGIAGSISYRADLTGFANAPVETINYVSCHDNLTLWDRIHINEPWETEHLKIDMDLFAQTLVFVSQGIPFIQSGEEFLRTKHGEENTYISGDEINALDWRRKMEYFQVFSYYKGLIQLRKNHPAFRMKTAEQVRAHLEFLDTLPPLIAWALKNYANHDPWENILVICNPLRTIASMSLPPGIWAIVVDKGRAGTTPLGFVEHEVQVKPISCLVLYQLPR